MDSGPIARSCGRKDCSDVTTLLLTHPASSDHDMGDSHPERPDRIRAIERALEKKRSKFWRAIQRRAQRARRCCACIRKPMSPRSSRRAEQGLARLDADTSMSPGTLAAAMHAAGGAIFAVDEVLAGARNAFVATRPPGHHAERRRRWAFASSTTPRSPRATPRPCMGWTRRHRRFRRSSRQWHAGHFLERPERDVRLDA